MKTELWDKIDVQVVKLAGGFFAQCGAHQGQDNRSALAAARKAAAGYYGVPETRIELDVESGFIVASLKGGAA